MIRKLIFTNHKPETMGRKRNPGAGHKPFQKGNKFGCGSKKSTTTLSLSKYIKKKTNEGKILTNFYIGILKAVEDSGPENVPMYKGMRVMVELSSKAVDWLGKNGWDTPSQRKPEDEKPKRTESELVTRLHFVIKKLVKDRGISGQIVELLGKAGL